MTAPDWLQVYRDSFYAVADPRSKDSPQWCGFRLNAQEGAAVPKELLEILGDAQSGTMITAWNPMSKETAVKKNRSANIKLKKAILSHEGEIHAAFGASLPGVTPAWSEEGFFVRGWDLEQALSWAFFAQQRAVVYWTAQSIGLLYCPTATFHPCGAVLEQEDPRLKEAATWV